MRVETWLSMLTLVCHFKHVMHRVWAYFQARLAFTWPLQPVQWPHLNAKKNSMTTSDLFLPMNFRYYRFANPASPKLTTHYAQLPNSFDCILRSRRHRTSLPPNTPPPTLLSTPNHSQPNMCQIPKIKTLKEDTSKIKTGASQEEDRERRKMMPSKSVRNEHEILGPLSACSTDAPNEYRQDSPQHTVKDSLSCIGG